MELSSNGILNDAEVYCNWSTVGCESELKKTLTLSPLNKSVDLEDVVQLETCIHLQAEQVLAKETPCIVTIKLPKSSTDLISQVAIVSEARIVELFGSCGEYLTTCAAEYVDDFEDCAVFMADCRFKPSQELVIKFQRTKHTDSMWLYGINLKLSQVKGTLPALSSINFQSVNEYLKEAKAPISENAEKCKSFLQSYGGALGSMPPQYKNKSPNPQMLLKMLEAGYFNPLGETGKNVSKCLSNFVPFLTRDDAESKSMPESEVNQNNCGPSSDMLLLKGYIDQRFSELECKIDRFEQKMKELEIRQNEKLDCIIALLNKPNK